MAATTWQWGVGILARRSHAQDEAAAPPRKARERPRAGAHRCNAQRAESLRRVDIHNACGHVDSSSRSRRLVQAPGHGPPRVTGRKPLPARPLPADARTHAHHRNAQRVESFRADISTSPRARSPGGAHALGSRPIPRASAPKSSPDGTGRASSPSGCTAIRVSSRTGYPHRPRLRLPDRSRSPSRCTATRVFPGLGYPHRHTSRRSIGHSPSRSRYAAKRCCPRLGKARRARPPRADGSRSPMNCTAMRVHSRHGYPHRDAGFAIPDALRATSNTDAPHAGDTSLNRIPTHRIVRGPDTTSKRAFHPVECSMLTVERHSVLRRVEPRCPLPSRRIGIGNPRCVACMGRCPMRPLRPIGSRIALSAAKPHRFSA